jgi:hypothetical protein
MKNFKLSTSLILLMFTLTFVSPTHCKAGSLSRDDKRAHMAASYGLFLTSSYYLEKKKPEWSYWKKTLISALGTLALGYAKESLIDDKNDSKDMLANTVGVAAGVGFTFFVHKF